MKLFDDLKKKLQDMREENHMKDDIKKEAEAQAWTELKPELVEYYKKRELQRIAEKDGLTIKGKKVEGKSGSKKPLFSGGSMKGFGAPDLSFNLPGQEQEKQPKKGESQKSMFEPVHYFEEPKKEKGKAKKEQSMFEPKNIF